jgi:hypothetical protein
MIILLQHHAILQERVGERGGERGERGEIKTKRVR